MTTHHAYAQHFVVHIGISDQVTHQYETIQVKATQVTTETFIPKILVDLGVMPSISEVRRNRKDLLEHIQGTGFQRIVLGKRIIDIFHKTEN